MYASIALMVSLLGSWGSLGAQWPFNDTQSMASSDLVSKSLWAEQLSISLLPSYSVQPDQDLVPNLCLQLLHEFANISSDLSNCLASAAWPVRVCQLCYKEYAHLKAIMNRIGSPLQNSTLSCAATLLRSDRVQVIVALNDFFDDLWKDAKCANCLETNNTGILNNTARFMKSFELLVQCFNRTMQEPATPLQKANYSEVCQECNESYKDLNEQYTKLGHTSALCIDLEDAMNSTRRLWSKTFNCTLPCTDTVPVIAVSAFILFLPIVFYLSSFLHSEQKKRKLILPKRLKSGTSMTHVQDKST
ncbi:osteopetrosis-associated transmembrane protein 1 [Hyperolius riggenbachi]|uniref:osteopetrosis-associated transmembrane protein 1 n=1 Tax=Hyperolius riggenbachi TaxID=752182 RepID=UPI0035A2A058